MKRFTEEASLASKDVGAEYRAIILAAGSGRRLLPYTKHTPKCLVDINGRTVLDQQLSVLRGMGVQDFVIVTGFEQEQTRASALAGANFVHNRRFAETNSAYSLWLAREHLRGKCLILNSDVLFGPNVLRSLLLHPFPDVIAFDSGSHLEHEETKVRVGVHGRLDSIGKEIHPSVSQGEHLGLIRLSKSGSRILAQTLNETVAVEGRANDWVPNVLQEFLRVRPVFGVDIAGDPWIEIDHECDLLRARNEVFPRLLGENTGEARRAGSSR